VACRDEQQNETASNRAGRGGYENAHVFTVFMPSDVPRRRNADWRFLSTGSELIIALRSQTRSHALAGAVSCPEVSGEQRLSLL
jgi:hypothetical protein